ncbi:MAG TPA: WD40 repeat domain-containing protein, partial [Haliscomenobacter sp.]|nr:WD40 repeat domain-containing protein [Haliscomenobacter sp.]
AATNLPLKAIFPVADGQEWLGLLADQSLVLLRDGKMLPFNTGSEQAVFDGAMASSGGKLLAGTTSGKAWLWVPGANAAVPVNAHPEAILATSASPDGKYWLTASRDNNTRLWSAEGSLLRTFEGHTGNVYGAIFSPDGQNMLARSSDGSLRLWNVSSGSPTLLPNPPLYSYDVLFSVSGSKILAAGHDGKLYRWNSQGNALLALALHRGPIRQLSLSPNQQYILTEGIDSTLALLSPEAELLAKFDDPTAPICISGIDPLGQHLAMGVKDHSIRLYNFARRETQVLRGHQAEIVGLEFSTNGKNLLSTAKDGTVRLWDLQGNLLLEVKLGSTTVPIAATFSPDGKKIIAASNDNKTLLECPTPEAAMVLLQNQEPTISAKLDKIKRDYHIQFIE